MLEQGGGVDGAAGPVAAAELLKRVMAGEWKSVALGIGYNVEEGFMVVVDLDGWQACLTPAETAAIALLWTNLANLEADDGSSATDVALAMIRISRQAREQNEAKARPN